MPPKWTDHSLVGSSPFLPLPDRTLRSARPSLRIHIDTSAEESSVLTLFGYPQVATENRVALPLEFFDASVVRGRIFVLASKQYRPSHWNKTRFELICECI